MTIDDKEMSSEEEARLIHENVAEQLRNPTVRKDQHIRLSKIWQTTQNIKSIQAELVKGYSFDKDKLSEMVTAMFSFINGVVKPEAESDIASEIVTEEIVADEK
jgi:hypothetical protein